MEKSICTGYRHLLIILVALSFSFASNAAERFTFERPEQRETFETTLQHLRCLVCQNQSLAESHAMFAEDLKVRVYQQVQAGHSEAEIVAELTEKYGDYVRYEPPFRMSTALLWLGPLFIFLFLFNRFRKK